MLQTPAGLGMNLSGNENLARLTQHIIYCRKESKVKETIFTVDNHQYESGAMAKFANPKENTMSYDPTKPRNKKHLFNCKCGNVVYSALPNSEQEQTEVIKCPRCQTPILFSTIALPQRIGYPVSRRQWQPMTSGVWRQTLAQRQNA
jgi:hypothetical protein